MPGRKGKMKLALEIIDAKILKSLPQGQLVEFTIESNKPIPPATQGTLCLRGKQT
ncbi:hypothetical protein [Paenibacillus gansuensis]|uniref:Uncharacterized protein n=1 Tax=Paenibacillus gansuensis TaxID=306542 RepID=A0ABW5PCR0_9BACL